MKKVRIHFIDGSSVEISTQSWRSVTDRALMGAGNMQSIYENEIFIASFMLSNVTYVEPITQEQLENEEFVNTHSFNKA